jgi:hypothetical protein
MNLEGQLQKRQEASSIKNAATQTNLAPTQEFSTDIEMPPELPKNPLQELMRKRNILQAQRAEQMKEARSSDSNRTMLANAIKGLGSIGAAEVQRNAGVDVGLKDFQPVKAVDTATQVGKDNDALLNSLKEDYQLMQSDKKGDLTAYQKAQLEERKKDRALKEKIAKLTKKTKAKPRTKLEEEREKDIAERFSTLEEQRPNSMASIEEANFLIKELEKGNISTGPGSKLAGNVGAFFDTDESNLKERLDSLAEKAARAQLKANGETRPTDADVEGMKTAMFNLGNTETTNIGKLKDFIKQQEAGLDEYNQMKAKLDNKEGLEDFLLKPTYTPKPTNEKVSVEMADGRRGSIPKSKLKAFQKKHPKAKILE